VGLTEAERKLLDELEATLISEDPKLVSKFAQPHRRIHPTKAVVGVIGFLLGLLGLVVGMSSFWWISVLGFVVMLVSAVVVVSGWSRMPGELPSSSARVPSDPNRESFMDMMARRWNERRDEMG
jgi:protein-S-isoprenylcysteine O-methyltransferase Ste14